MNNEDGASTSQTIAHLVDYSGAETATGQVHMYECPTVLNYLAKHLVDLIFIILTVGVVFFNTFHDIVPREVQISQSSIFLQDLKQWIHLLWSELVPADVKRSKRLLGTYNIAQIRQTEVIKWGRYQGEFAKVVSLFNAFN